MRLLWLSDIHLDFVNDTTFDSFFAHIRTLQPNRVLLGGDIATAAILETSLTRILDALGPETHLDIVLGNHDYYGSDIQTTRSLVEACSQDHERLHWLARSAPIALSSSTSLIGHGGWGDAYLGDWEGSTVLLNDYLKIRDLVHSSRGALRDTLHALGQEAARVLRRSLERALETTQRVLILMHVPPYREACWHMGETSDDNWLPHFSCGAVGAMISEVMRAHPEASCLVLCGHTHSRGEAQLLPNVRVITGQATYRTPEVQGVWDTDEERTWRRGAFWSGNVE